jgi:hypothetical protein
MDQRDAAAAPRARPADPGRRSRQLPGLGLNLADLAVPGVAPAAPGTPRRGLAIRHGVSG